MCASSPSTVGRRAPAPTMHPAAVLSLRAVASLFIYYCCCCCCCYYILYIITAHRAAVLSLRAATSSLYPHAHAHLCSCSSFMLIFHAHAHLRPHAHHAGTNTGARGPWAFGTHHTTTTSSAGSLHCKHAAAPPNIRFAHLARDTARACAHTHTHSLGAAAFCLNPAPCVGHVCRGRRTHAA